MKKAVCLDIEVTPRKVYVWSGRNYEVDVIEEIEPWYMLCYSWRWLDHVKTSVFSQRLAKGYKPGKMNDYEVVKTLRNLLDEADTVLTHNGKKFDIKKFNSRCLFHKIPPPSSFHQIDTLQLFRGTFAEDSNKLQEIASKYGLGSKIEHNGFPLWKAVMRGEKSGWEVMERYNKRDVDLTVAAYELIKEWTERKKPVIGKPPCPKCQSPATRKRGSDYYRNLKGIYQTHGCNECGHRWPGAKVIERV